MTMSDTPVFMIGWHTTYLEEKANSQVKETCWGFPRESSLPNPERWTVAGNLGESWVRCQDELGLGTGLWLSSYLAGQWAVIFGRGNFSSGLGYDPSHFNHQVVQGTFLKGIFWVFSHYTVKASKFLVFFIYNFTALFYSFFILHDNNIRY